MGVLHNNLLKRDIVYYNIYNERIDIVFEILFDFLEKIKYTCKIPNKKEMYDKFRTIPNNL